MQNKSIYIKPIQWKEYYQESDYYINVFGHNEKNEVILVRIKHNPECYIELKNGENITNILTKLINEKVNIIKQEKEVKKNMWGYNKGEYKVIKITCKNMYDIYKMKKILKKEIEEEKVELYENTISQILKYQTKYELKNSEWIKIKNIKRVEEIKDKRIKKISKCKEEYILNNSKNNIETVTDIEKLEKLGTPIPSKLSFDLEVNSSNIKTMPKPYKPEDIIFCTNITFKSKDKYEKHALVLDYCDIRKYKYKKVYYIDHREKIYDSIEKLIKDKEVLKDYLNEKDNEYRRHYKKKEIKENIENKTKVDIKEINENINEEIEMYIHICKNEIDMMEIFCEIVNILDADILMGHNIFGFDIPYWDARIGRINKTWRNMSRYIEYDVAMKNINWNSSAYSDVDISYWDIPGRIVLDTLPIFSRDYKLPNYKLDTLAKHFLNKHKVDLSPQELFRKYKTKDREDLGDVMIYCDYDTQLPIELIENCNIWITLVETSNIVNIDIFDTYTRGQSVRVFNQTYKLLSKQNYLIVKKRIKKDTYEGAYVHDGIPGVYSDVMCFDFASLYPSIMISHNFCYTTLIDENTNIPDDKCHICDFVDNKTGKKYYYKWIKQDYHKGIIPTLLENLNSSRKIIKNEMEKTDNVIYILESIRNLIQNKPNNINYIDIDFDYLTKFKINVLYDNNCIKFLNPNINKYSLLLTFDINNKIINLNLFYQHITNIIDKLKINYNIFDAKQKAIKVSTNSVYGGVSTYMSDLPLLCAGMCTTYIGRKSILDSNKKMEQDYKALTVYGDTDSTFPQIPGIRKHIKHIKYIAEYISNDASSMFIKPMKLEFEKAFHRLLIIQKKMYCGYLIDIENPELNLSDYNDKQLDKFFFCKGLPIVKRDRCLFMKNLCKSLCHNILFNRDIFYCLSFVEHQLFLLFWGLIPISDLLIVSKLAKDYKNPNFHLAILKQFLKNRGEIIEANERVEYLYVSVNDPLLKIGYRLRTLKYFKLDNCTVDYEYYITNRISSIINKILCCVFPGIPKNYIINTFLPFLKIKKQILSDIRNKNFHLKHITY